MKSEQVHLLLVVGIIACISYYLGYKAGTYYGANRELAKIVRDSKL